jgi:hypothetical protein
MMKTLLHLDAPSLCREAQRRTGLKEFGKPRLEPALSTLLQSLEEEGDLHALGRFLMRTHLRGLLETRLRLVESWRARRLLAVEPLKQPIFIVGVPRSGSTYLHELLAQIPGHRAPRAWEVMFPVRRWNDPAFPAAFPWFNTQRYWQDRILELKEQIALMDEPPLVPA